MYASSKGSSQSQVIFSVRFNFEVVKLLATKAIVRSQWEWGLLPGLRDLELKSEKTHSIKRRCLSACAGRDVRKSSSGGGAPVDIRLHRAGITPADLELVLRIQDARTFCRDSARNSLELKGQRGTDTINCIVVPLVSCVDEVCGRVTALAITGIGPVAPLTIKIFSPLAGIKPSLSFLVHVNWAKSDQAGENIDAVSDAIR